MKAKADRKNQAEPKASLQSERASAREGLHQPGRAARAQAEGAGAKPIASIGFRAPKMVAAIASLVVKEKVS